MEKLKIFVALIRYFILRQKPGCSTFIDENTITLGYGQCLSLGDFEYPLPMWVIKRRYGAVLWFEYDKIHHNDC